MANTHYLLGERLGQGGMGVVYAATQPALERSVAIKLLHPTLASNPEMVERFHAEAVAGSRLSHPNVAGVIDFGEMADGTPYLVMERVTGERLAQILEREGMLSGHRACHLVGQLLAALAATHAAGVIHADVKCDNILVREQDGVEVVTLIDFGIARLVDRAETVRHDRHLLSGTPEYIAPELIVGGTPTAASDIYAAGIVLYELLTGEPPFHGGSATEIFERHLGEDVIAPSLRQPDAAIAPALDRVVLRALHKDPARRHASAVQFAAALLAAAPDRTQAAPVVARTASYTTEAPTQDWPVSMRRRLASGTSKQTRNHAVRLRIAIGAAIHAGDRAAIARAYLDLARALVASHRPDIAARELTQAVDILTAGDGPDTDAPPEMLWSVLLALASIQAGACDAEHAYATARQARVAAAHVHSHVGCDRACALLQKLDHAT